MTLIKCLLMSWEMIQILEIGERDFWVSPQWSTRHYLPHLGVIWFARQCVHLIPYFLFLISYLTYYDLWETGSYYRGLFYRRRNGDLRKMTFSNSWGRNQDSNPDLSACIPRPWPLHYTVVSPFTIYSFRIGKTCPQYKNYHGSHTFLTSKSGNALPQRLPVFPIIVSPSRNIPRLLPV